MYKQLQNAQELIKSSKSTPVILFKESLTCPVSARAKEQMDEFVSNGSPYPVYILSVQEQKEISDDLAEILKVKNETPQVILVDDGKAVDILNHNDITAVEIEEMVM